MTVGLITNDDKEEARAYAGEVSAFLRKQGAKVRTDAWPDADFWVVLGGDGTMLHASHHAAVRRIPLLGINFGNLGFLTDVDRHEGLQAIGRVLQGEGTRESRLMLEADGDADISRRLALNDVYISPGGHEKLILLDIYINGKLIDSLRADGVLIATPTGSTAYNLSAGGPILMPDGDMMVIIAVCPHNLHMRPWVVAARDEVSVVPRRSADLAIDGERRAQMQAGERLTLRRSEIETLILKTSGLHFYEILRRKMYH